MKRVLVTGGSGFIGANLTRRLLRDGHEVHLLLRESHHTWRVRDIEADVEILLVNLEDRDAVAGAVRAIRPEWVFHLAAHGGYSTQCDVGRMVATNISGSMALLDACVDTGVEAFVHTGSSSEYGYKDRAAREVARIEPNSAYAVTKAAATHYCQLVARQHGVNAVTARLYSIYGPFEEPARFIPRLVTYGLRGQLPPLVSPRTARDFVYVDDAVQAVLQIAVARPALPGAVYNVCSGIQYDLASVVSIARKLMHVAAEPVWSQMPPRPWDTETWIGSPDLMKHEIGWTSETTLEAGMQRTIDWFRDVPDWLRESYSQTI
jgi:UDP-glucose 4-epimerase